MLSRLACSLVRLRLRSCMRFLMVSISEESEALVPSTSASIESRPRAWVSETSCWRDEIPLAIESFLSRLDFSFSSNLATAFACL